MQLNKIRAVKTVDRVAAELGKTVDHLHDLAIEDASPKTASSGFTAPKKCSPSPRSAVKTFAR
ncbi:MAG: hypothetical protein LBE86_00070 [Gemmobacter sp.]|jgi:hypothetical protein|nr:hypothetical protein [Gemmobacter sp.]